MTAAPSVSAGRPPWTGARWFKVLLYAFAVATPLGWSTVAFVYLGMNAWGRSISFERALLAGLPDWYLWAAATPIVFWLGERFRIERAVWFSSGVIHLLAGALVALSEVALKTGLNQLVGVAAFPGPLRDVYIRSTLQSFHFNFMNYWVIVAAAHAARYYHSYREQELTASQLQTELTQAQLAALQMQIQPHFFFNTLHAIATLVRDGRGDAAIDTLARLGDLFRETLSNAKRHEVRLRDELAFVDAYLDIERVRFSDRLDVRMHIEPGVQEARLPSMSLQPLVENAIRHGIALDASATLLAVEARRSNGRLHIEIRNDGPSYRADVPRDARRGLGLANIRARLSRLYGAQYRLDVSAGPKGGAIVVLEVPWRTGPEAHADRPAEGASG